MTIAPTAVSQHTPGVTRRLTTNVLIAAALVAVAYATSLVDGRAIGPLMPLAQLLVLSAISITAAVLFTWPLLTVVWLAASAATVAVVQPSLFEIGGLPATISGSAQVAATVLGVLLVMATTTPAVLYWRLVSAEWKNGGRADRWFLPRLVGRVLLVGLVLGPLALGFAFLSSAAFASRSATDATWPQTLTAITDSSLAVLPLYFLGLATVGTTVMFGLHWRDRAMRQRAEFEERARLQQDAHDRVYNRLTALSQKVALASGDATREGSEGFAHIAADIRDTVFDLQEILGDAKREPATAGSASSLATQLQQVCNAQAARLGMDVEFSDSATPPAVSSATPSDLPPAVSPSVGWDLQCIVEEALTNASRHGGATRCHVRLSATVDALTIEVTDNGSGMGAVPDIDQLPAESHGLRGMRQRLERSGGTLRISTAPGRTTLTAVLPIREP